MTLYTQPQTTIFAQNAPESEIKTFDAWARGLGIAFDETNGLPEMTGLNGLFNLLNQYIKYLEQNGLSEWRSDLEYPIGAGVRIGLNWYRAKRQNSNKNPTTSQNDWSVFLNANDLSFAEPLYLENGQVKVRDATNAVKGVVQFASNDDVLNASNISKAITPANAKSIANSSDIGVGQKWTNVINERRLNTEYANNTGKGIQLSIVMNDTGGNSPTVSLVVDGSAVFNTMYDTGEYFGIFHINNIIPAGAIYRVNGGNGASIQSWAELR